MSVYAVMVIALVAVVGLAVLFVVLVWLALMLAAGGFRHNEAKRQLRPVLRRVSELPARFVCGSGDSATGIDNHLPWYDAFYVAEPTDLTAKLADIARSFGFEAATTEDQQWQEDGASLLSTMRSDDRKLTLRITPAGTPTIGWCGMTAVDDVAKVPPGQCLVTVSLVLPQRFAANRLLARADPVDPPAV